MPPFAHMPGVFSPPAKARWFQGDVAAGMRRRPEPRRRASVAEYGVLVGSVVENRVEHLKRYASFEDACPRCRWYSCGASWLLSKASIAGSSPSLGKYWLKERPVSHPGFQNKFEVYLDPSTQWRNEFPMAPPRGKICVGSLHSLQANMSKTI
jgi:hypothetical protein